MGRALSCGKRPGCVEQLVGRSALARVLIRNCHIEATFVRRDSSREEGFAMNNLEYNAKLDELDHLLNDDDNGAIEPSRIWDLLAEVSHHDLQRRQSRHG